MTKVPLAEAVQISSQALFAAQPSNMVKVALPQETRAIMPGVRAQAFIAAPPAINFPGSQQ